MTPWTIAHQAPLSFRILQARILEWVAIPFSRGSSQPRDRTCIPCIARRILNHWTTRKSQNFHMSQNVSLLILLQLFEYVKIVLSGWAAQKQHAGWICPAVHRRSSAVHTRWPLGNVPPGLQLGWRVRSRARARLHVASSTSSSRCMAVSLGGPVLSLFPPLCSEVWQPLGGSWPCPVTSPML